MHNKTKLLILLLVIWIIWAWFFLMTNDNIKNKIWLWNWSKTTNWIDYKYSAPKEIKYTNEKFAESYDSWNAKKLFSEAKWSDKFIFHWNELTLNDKNWKIEFWFTYKALHWVTVIARLIDVDIDFSKIKPEDIIYTHTENVMTNSKWGWTFRYNFMSDNPIYIQIKDIQSWAILKQFTIQSTEESNKRLKSEKIFQEMVENYKATIWENWWDWDFWWPQETDIDYETILKDIDPSIIENLKTH